MSTSQKSIAEVRDEWLDLAYAICKELGLIRLARLLGRKPKPWVLEREKLDPPR